jgi:hypothetical protein
MNGHGSGSGGKHATCQFRNAAAAIGQTDDARAQGYQTNGTMRFVDRAYSP